jgi:hypothetical protein
VASLAAICRLNAILFSHLHLDYFCNSPNINAFNHPRLANVTVAYLEHPPRHRDALAFKFLCSHVAVNYSVTFRDYVVANAKVSESHIPGGSMVSQTPRKIVIFRRTLDPQRLRWRHAGTSAGRGWADLIGHDDVRGADAPFEKGQAGVDVASGSLRLRRPGIARRIARATSESTGGYRAPLRHRT